MIGLQDYKWGESVTAICVLAPDFEATEDLADEIMDYGKKNLASFKVPKKVFFIDYEDVPRTGSGKIIHRILRERYNKIISQKP
ncbi:MAG: AMP-binding enzyme [Candidatus Hodarchaeales archaeon]